MADPRTRIELSLRYTYDVRWNADATPSYEGKVTEFPSISIRGESFQEVAALLIASVEAEVVSRIIAGGTVPRPLVGTSPVVMSNAGRRSFAERYNYQASYLQGDYKVRATEYPAFSVLSDDLLDAAEGAMGAVASKVAQQINAGAAFTPPSRAT